MLRVFVRVCHDFAPLHLSLVVLSDQSYELMIAIVIDWSVVDVSDGEKLVNAHVKWRCRVQKHG